MDTVHKHSAVCAEPSSPPGWRSFGSYPAVRRPRGRWPPLERDEAERVGRGLLRTGFSGGVSSVHEMGAWRRASAMLRRSSWFCCEWKRSVSCRRRPCSSLSAWMHSSRSSYWLGGSLPDIAVSSIFHTLVVPRSRWAILTVALADCDHEFVPDCGR